MEERVEVEVEVEMEVEVVKVGVRRYLVKSTHRATPRYTNPNPNPNPNPTPSYLVEVLAGRLLGARQHRAHHHNGGAARDRLVRGGVGVGVGVRVGVRGSG